MRRRAVSVLHHYSCFVLFQPHEMSRGENARRPVSRVLSAPCGAGRPFLWDAHCCAPHATNPGCGAEMLLRHRSGLPASAAGRPYSVLLPVGFTLPPLSPGARCALAAPFHPCRRRIAPDAGGLFSVALSLGSPPPAVSRHRIPVEPGLSSTGLLPPGSGRPAVWRAGGAPVGGRCQRLRFAGAKDGEDFDVAGRFVVAAVSLSPVSGVTL